MNRTRPQIPPCVPHSIHLHLPGVVVNLIQLNSHTPQCIYRPLRVFFTPRLEIIVKEPFHELRELIGNDSLAHVAHQAQLIRNVVHCDEVRADGLPCGSNYMDIGARVLLTGRAVAVLLNRAEVGGVFAGLEK